MEENEGGGAGGGGTGTRTYGHIWWALASAAQLGWAISSFKRGHAGDSHFMPFKAFSVASLFVGATATAAISVLHVSGIHKIYFATCAASESLGGRPLGSGCKYKDWTWSSS
nr:hypothetical protein CFP56_08446 [Quercus suber]